MSWHAGTRISLGNVSTQPFTLESDEVQEELRKRFLGQLREAVRLHAAVTQEGKRTNEQICFRVKPHSNVTFPFDAVATKLQRAWPGLGVSMVGNEIQFVIPCAKRRSGPNHLAYEFSYLLSYAALVLVSAGALAFTWRCDCTL